MSAPVVVRWEDPPLAKTGKRPMPAEYRARQTARWQAVADALRAKPGEWAVVADEDYSSSAIVTSVTLGRWVPFAPAGSFQACQRTNQTDAGPLVEVYARYVGDGGEYW